MLGARWPQLFPLEGFQQIVVSALADIGGNCSNILGGGHHHQRHIREPFLQTFETDHFVQFGTREHQFEVFPRTEQGLCFATRRSRHALLTCRGQHGRDNPRSSFWVFQADFCLF